MDQGPAQVQPAGEGHWLQYHSFKTSKEILCGHVKVQWRVAAGRDCLFLFFLFFLMKDMKLYMGKEIAHLVALMNE